MCANRDLSTNVLDVKWKNKIIHRAFYRHWNALQSASKAESAVINESCRGRNSNLVYEYSNAYKSNYITWVTANFVAPTQHNSICCNGNNIQFGPPEPQHAVRNAIKKQKTPIDCCAQLNSSQPCPPCAECRTKCTQHREGKLIQKIQTSFLLPPSSRARSSVCFI